MNEQHTYIDFAKRWYWLIALGIVVAGVATYIALDDRVALYRATSTIQVGRALDEENPRPDELAITERLIPLYAETAVRTPILTSTIEELGLNMSVGQLRSQILVSPVPRTQLIDIHVVSTDPAAASALANEVARQVVLASPSSPDETIDSETEDFIRNQLEDLQGKITAAQSEIDEKQSAILSMTSAADIYDAQQRINVLSAQVEVWQENYAVLLEELEPSSTNIVRVASPATIPAQSLPQDNLLYYGLAIVMGGSLATLLALGLNQLDRSLRSRHDIETINGHQEVIDIPHFGRRRDRKPIVLAEPTSDVTASYRTLRNIVELTRKPSMKPAFAVTSSDVGEGKTTTVANLGVALANSDRFVLLVDANLRNPELEELFELDAAQGFSELVLDNLAIEDVMQPTGHPNLWVIGAGTIPENYPDVLASTRISTVVDQLLERADVVLFDSPALAQEQESQLLAKMIGQAILVTEAGHTTRDSLERALDMLESSGVSVGLMVFNKVPRSRILRFLRTPWSRKRRLEAEAAERRHAGLAQMTHPSTNADTAVQSTD